MYEVERDGTPFILRLTHSSHRSKQEVEGELKWINFLHGHDIQVSLVHPSKNGELVEVLPVDDSFFYVCLFDKAPGTSIKMNSPEFGPELFKKWGAITAKMHLVTENYHSSETERLRWDEDDLIELEKFIDPIKDEAIIEGNRQRVSSSNSYRRLRKHSGYFIQTYIWAISFMKMGIYTCLTSMRCIPISSAISRFHYITQLGGSIGKKHSKSDPHLGQSS